MPYPPVARLSADSRHTGAHSASSPAGHWLEMSVEWQISQLPDMSEPHNWRRSVTGKWRDVSKLASRFPDIQREGTPNLVASRGVGTGRSCAARFDAQNPG